jgi:hypothetical protein
MSAVCGARVQVFEGLDAVRDVSGGGLERFCC